MQRQRTECETAPSRRLRVWGHARSKRRLPTWESFPHQERQLLVSLLIRAGRRQLANRSGGELAAEG